MLQANGIVHAYAGKPALDGVDFTLRAGEVHALMGQNGAGKSTLIKVLTGAEVLQRGSIQLDGQRIAPATWTRIVVGILLFLFCVAQRLVEGRAK